ncbi:hypothetical protein BY996DRAFT_8269052 [Phakopsora pachyrhizi]|nr:hypothetical protein BY996DRAFT_8269052 [Phakopsora pachyrhizi]
MNAAIRSLPGTRDELDRIKPAQSFLDFQFERLKGDKPEIQKSLDGALKNCINCRSKDRHQIIMLAAESGIKVDKYLKDLDSVECTTKEQCLLQVSSEKKSKKSSGVNNKSQGSILLKVVIVIFGLVVWS